MEANKVSAIILAGGFSSRMGKDKAELTLGGKTLIELQTERLQSLGIEDIMLSGYGKPLKGTRCIPDVYPHRGPVSGVHACLLQAHCTACVVISVDVPLLPADTIASLVRAHHGGATVLTHCGKQEPLIAVYDTSLAGKAEEILLSEKTAVRKLLDMVSVTEYNYSGAEDLLENCNTPEQFERISSIYEK